MKTNRKFRKELVQIVNKGIITVVCPSCTQYFGLDPRFVEKVSEVAYKFACPYCGSRHLLKND